MTWQPWPMSVDVTRSRSDQPPRVLPDTVPRRGADAALSEERTPFGRYSLFEVLGQTAYTEVFRARVDGPEGFEKTCAVERLASLYLNDPAALEAFQFRAQLGSRLHHPNLVEVYDAGQVDGQPYVAREYVDGMPLSAYLDACREADTAPPVALALYITGELCRAVSYLQGLTDGEGRPKPIAHGNLSPRHIFLGRQGAVKLIDFALPESGEVDAGNDLIDVAHVCHAILLSREPTEAERDTLASVPPRLAAVLRRAISGHLDPNGLQDGVIDFGFDAGVRVSDWALTQSLQALDGGDVSVEGAPTTRPVGSARPTVGEPTYRVQSAAGSRLGVISQANLTSMLLSDVLAPTAMVSVDYGPWQPLEELPIFNEVGQREEVPSVATMSAPLDAMSLPAFALQIGLEGLSGCLRMRQGALLKQFWFRRGVPVHSSSTSEDELLGPSMVRAGLIDDAALEAAQRVMTLEGGLLGEVLLRHGLCSAGALHRGLEEQLRHRFHALLHWPLGDLSFIEGHEPVGEVLRMSYDAVQLVTEMVRRCYDEAKLLELLQPYLDASLSLDAEGPVTHDSLRLNGRELRQLGSLMEGMSLREQLQQRPDAPEERLTILRVVFLLFSAKVVSFDSLRQKKRTMRRR
ncbi:MAG: serine/threonine protein kinase [Myxococcota bacterium]